MTGGLNLNGNEIETVGSIAFRQSEGDEGFSLSFEGTPTAPECVFYGTNGDEAVELKGVATPTEDHSAATKKYVDEKVTYLNVKSFGAVGDGATALADQITANTFRLRTFGASGTVVHWVVLAF